MPGQFCVENKDECQEQKAYHTLSDKFCFDWQFHRKSQGRSNSQRWSIRASTILRAGVMRANLYTSNSHTYACTQTNTKRDHRFSGRGEGQREHVPYSMQPEKI
eukprot:1158197-Pelagomonas_calceolata.AAC.5